jgi:serine/threonine protein kinase
MTVVQKIVEGEPPQLEGSCWSEEFKHFVSLCLVKKPKLRANGKNLLEHPFLAKARDANYLKNNFLKDLKPVD